MRKYIFNFEQEKAVNLGLNLQQLLILDYLQDFIKSGAMNHKDKDGTRFFLVVYKKLLKDLPVLDIKERQLRNLFKELETKKVVRILSLGSSYLYIHIEYWLLCGNILPDFGKKLPDSIDKLNNKNKIKIIYNITKKPACSRLEFLKAYKNELKNYMTSISYDLFFAEGLSIDSVDSSGITFNVKNAPVAERMKNHMLLALASTFSKLLEEETQNA